LCGGGNQEELRRAGCVAIYREPADLLGQYDSSVPPEWLRDVREANDDSLLALADHLPNEAAEALLELATGGKPKKS
jgi:hypothetical protein